MDILKRFDELIQRTSKATLNHGDAMITAAILTHAEVVNELIEAVKKEEELKISVAEFKRDPIFGV